MDCPTALIPWDNEEAVCVEDSDIDPPHKKNQKWDAEIYFSGLASSQLASPKPISQWGLHVGLPITKHAKIGVSIDNPVLGENLPSKLIQPARSSYSLDVQVQQFHKNDQSHIRLIFTHTSDHTVEELLDHSNNQFKQRSSGGEINALGVSKKWIIDKQHENDVTLAWIDMHGHVNISRLIEIPGYLLSDLTSHGIMVKSRHQYQWGKKAQNNLNLSVAGVRHLKPKPDNLSHSADYLLAGASLDLSLQKLHPNLHLVLSNLWVAPFRIQESGKHFPFAYKSHVSTTEYRKPHTSFQVSLLFDMH